MIVYKSEKITIIISEHVNYSSLYIDIGVRAADFEEINLIK